MNEHPQTDARGYSADPKYTAESLEDIAAHFRKLADFAEERRQKDLKRPHVESFLRGEKCAWLEAARILGATKLKGL